MAAGMWSEWGMGTQLLRAERSGFAFLACFYYCTVRWSQVARRWRLVEPSDMQFHVVIMQRMTQAVTWSTPDRRGGKGEGKSSGKCGN